MPVSADTLRIHLDYTAWAASRLLEAAGEVIAGGIDARFWDRGQERRGHARARVRSGPRLDRQNSRAAAGEISLPTRIATYLCCNANGRRCFDLWEEWAAGLTDENVTQVASYQDLKGNPYHAVVEDRPARGESRDASSGTSFRDSCGRWDTSRRRWI